MMRNFALLLAASAGFSLASPIVDSALTARATSSAPIVNLGKGGTYKGALVANGTVEAWKGIPYAMAPTGNLRYKAPVPYYTKSSETVDVSDDALRCIQFTGGVASNQIGVKSGPGVEDCLKMWVWKPVKASKGDKLPVMLYIHGGGLQYSAAANNDFTDWVGHDQDFIAVNMAYRLGHLGFLASEELKAEGSNANAAFLDQRLATQWVVDNIAQFGGNPQDITLMGQSGGGYAVIAQMALYDGVGTKFQRAVPRSIQRSPAFTISELRERNNAFAGLLGCPDSGNGQLACFRNQTPSALVNASTALGKLTDSKGLPYSIFLPSIDGVTLTDSLTNLFLKGRFAGKPLLVGSVADEGANIVLASKNATAASQIAGVYNLSSNAEAYAATLYPVNTTFSDFSGTDNFYASDFAAALHTNAGFGEAGIMGSERLLAKTMSTYADSSKVWSFRFNAPTVGVTTHLNATFPLAYVTHSADNSYLQNMTSVMSDTEKAMAFEWRAYVGSFIRTGNPNTQKLSTARTWPCYDALGNFEELPIRLAPTFAFSSNANSSLPTGTQPEVMHRAQLERVDWWQSEEVLKMTRL